MRFGPKLKSHPAFLRATGLYWQQCREEAELQMSIVAHRMGISADELSLFEGGLSDVADLPEDFTDRLSQSIGLPETLKVYDELFGQRRGKRRAKVPRQRRKT